MITKLSFSGLKGQEREHSLGPLTLLEGPNGSGKTATLQAVMIGFLGYEPRLGKRPEATMSLAQNGRITVELATDKGFGVKRLFSFDPVKKAVSQEISLLGRSEQLQKEAEAEISASLGNFPVMFDLAEFTAMSPDRQRDFIFHLSPLDERKWNAASLLRHVMFRAICAALGEGVVAEAMNIGRKRGQTPLAGDFEEMSAGRQQGCLEMLSTKLDGAYRAALREILEDLAKHCSDDIQASLGGMLAALRSRARSARTRKAESEAAVRALSEERAKHLDGAVGADELRSALAEAEASLGALEKEAGVEQEKRREAARRAAEAAEALERTRARAAALEAAPLPDMAALKAAMDECALAIKEIPEAGLFADELRALDDAIAADVARRDAALRAKMEAAHAIEAAQEALKRIGAEVLLFRDGRCPVCGASANTRHIIALLERKRKEMARVTDEMEKKCRALMPEARMLEYFEGEIKSASARKEKVAESVAAAVEAARVKEKELADLERRFALAGQERAHRAEALAALKEEIARIERSLQTPARDKTGRSPLVSADAASEGRLESCRARVAEMRSALAGKERARGLVAAVEERICAARRGAVEHEVVGDLTAAAKGLRDALVAEIIGPLQRTVDEILPEINAEYRSYFALEDMRGKESFEFGRLKGAARIPFASLSGGETVLFSAALAVALILRAGPPEKVLLVEMGELDDENARAFLCGLTKLSRRLDNVICASCHDIDAPEGWRTIMLGAEKEESGTDGRGQPRISKMESVQSV